MNRAFGSVNSSAPNPIVKKKSLTKPVTPAAAPASISIPKTSVLSASQRAVIAMKSAEAAKRRGCRCF